MNTGLIGTINQGGIKTHAPITNARWASTSLRLLEKREIGEKIRRIGWKTSNVLSLSPVIIKTTQLSYEVLD